MLCMVCYLNEQKSSLQKLRYYSFGSSYPNKVINYKIETMTSHLFVLKQMFIDRNKFNMKLS